MSSTPPVRVAQYVRMSTDHQRYSTENQSDANHAYAALHDMTVVRTYEDAGISGLRIKGRLGLQSLLRDVESGVADFFAILVYDVSRWGRFRNADEAASYEFRCTQGGVRVVYVAEAFTNDGSMQASVFKAVMRVMSYSYSKDLSDKVFAGHCKLLSLGYHQGGRPGFALRRQVVSTDRQFKGMLCQGERKGLQGDNVILVPGPQHEVDTVVRVFRMFSDDLMSERMIAKHLNEHGSRTAQDTEWSDRSVRRMLTNERYLGRNLYNRHTYRMGEVNERNKPEDWLRSSTGETQIVATELWDSVQALYLQRSMVMDDDTLLGLLKSLYDREGTLSGVLIDEQSDMPTSQTYVRRFGGLYRAYQLIGFDRRTDLRYIAENRVLKARHPEVVETVLRGLAKVNADVVINEQNGLLTINGHWTATVGLARCFISKRAHHWHLRFDESLRPDVAICVRVAHETLEPLDYYVFSRLHLQMLGKAVRERNAFLVDAFRFPNLDDFYSLAAREVFEEQVA